MVKYIPYKQLFIYYKSRKNEGVHMEINIGIIAIVVLAIAILASHSLVLRPAARIRFPSSILVEW